jgi:hypothetical protein
MEAIILGAGASYEFGMPLVWDLTEAIRDGHRTILETKDFQDYLLFEDWGDEPKKIFLDLFSNPKIHYEAVIGAFEIESIRCQPSSGFEKARAYLVDVTARYLTDQPRVGPRLMMDGLNLTRNFSKILNDQGPTDIFTLNHDVILEDILDHNQIQHKSGFHPDLNANIRYFKGNKLNHDFYTLTESQIAQRDLNFLAAHEYGVNIYKLHGALDTFLHNSCKDYVQFKPRKGDFFKHTLNIKEINKENALIEQQCKVRTLSILTLKDSSGTEHFFDRSLITGALKFEENHNKIKASQIFFEEFKRKITNYESLLCIGYGFGDQHINNEILKWLTQDRDRKLTIVDPFRDAAPAFAMHLSQQITIHKKSFLEFVAGQEELTTQRKKSIFLLQQELEFYKKHKPS